MFVADRGFSDLEGRMAELMSLAAMVGIDWSDQHHDISLQASGAPSVEHHVAVLAGAHAI